MNSTLATYRNVTLNQGGKRSGKIIGITPHYMVAQWSGKQCADYFVQCYYAGRHASCNYCIGINGDIAVSVDEDCHPWTSANWQNDDNHVTFECANLPDGSLSDATYQALVKLSADICKRHGINPHYDKNAGVGSTITMHRDVTLSGSTDCPGNWLAGKITSGQFERDVLNAMGTPVQTAEDDKPYRIRKSWDDAKSQIGAYNVLENAKNACKAGYKIYTKSGTLIYEMDASGNRWDYDAVLKVGDTVKSKYCTVSNRDGELLNVPALGGYVGTEDVNTSSSGKVALKQCRVVEILGENLVQISLGFAVKASPLGAKV